MDRRVIGALLFYIIGKFPFEAKKFLKSKVYLRPVPH